MKSKQLQIKHQNQEINKVQINVNSIQFLRLLNTFTEGVALA